MKEFNVEQLIERQLHLLMDFPRTNRYRDLFAEFWRKPDRVRERVVPLWNLSRSTLWRNWEVSEDDIPSCVLKLIPKGELFARMFCREAYAVPRLWRELHQDKALLIVDHWIRQVELTPPVLVRRSDGTWGKRDGFHRLGISLMCQPDPIPIWFEQAQEVDSNLPQSTNCRGSLRRIDFQCRKQSMRCAIREREIAFTTCGRLGDASRC